MCVLDCRRLFVIFVALFIVHLSISPHTPVSYTCWLLLSGDLGQKRFVDTGDCSCSSPFSFPFFAHTWPLCLTPFNAVCRVSTTNLVVDLPPPLSSHRSYQHPFHSFPLKTSFRTTWWWWCTWWEKKCLSGRQSTDIREDWHHQQPSSPPLYDLGEILEYYHCFCRICLSSPPSPPPSPLLSTALAAAFVQPHWL